MAYNSYSDHELWNLILKDDFRAFTALFDRHWPKLYKSAQRYIKNDDECEEIVHDLFLNIWKRKHFLIIEDFNKYFKAATRYQVYAFIEKQKNSHVILLETIGEGQEQYELNFADEKIAYHDLENQLNRHLNQLPKRCQEIFVLSRMNQLTNNEIARKLGISKRSVENQITAALQFIRFHMKDIVK